jgi:hypothetical protein
MQSSTPASSYRSRIGAHKSALAAAAAPVAAALALASISSTARATQPRPTVSQYTVFSYDPFFGSVDDMEYTGESYFNPIDGTLSRMGSETFPLGLNYSGYVYDFSTNADFLAEEDPGFGAQVAPLAPGSVVGASGLFPESYYHWFTWGTTVPVVGDGVTSNYLGFRLTSYGASFAETYYGWVEFTYSSSIQILRSGIGPDNTPVIVGASAIPEPAGVAALFGTLAVAATFGTRRRRS